MKEILRHAREVIQIEVEAVQGLLNRLDDNFVAAVQLLLACEGRAVITGIGKSGLVGHKMVATLISTGTPATFLHPVEGLHGDLGMVTAKDVIIAISNSGETAEIIHILPSLQKIGAKIIGLTGAMDSTLARSSHIVIDVGVEREACPLGLAPTSSTTAALVIGDALAVALMRQRKFTEKDFALFHPGGSLGEKLSFKIEDVMRPVADFPSLTSDKTVGEFILAINRSGADFALILQANGNLAGMVSDHDLRRGEIGSPDFLNRSVKKIMDPHPPTTEKEGSAAEAMKTMVEKNLVALPVLDKKKNLKGVVTLRDLLNRRDRGCCKMTPYPPKGLIVALVTPLNEECRIEKESFRRLIDRVVPYCDALMIGEGLTGEGLSLPNPLRMELLQLSTEIVAGGKPLFLCPTAGTIEETVANITVLTKALKHYPDQNSLFWVDIPLWYHSNRKLPQFYQEWKEYTPYPILLHNHPLLIGKRNRTLKRTNIRTAVLKQLSENGQIVGLIQSGDLKRTMHYQRAVRTRRDFRFFDGDEENFLNSPSSSGVVSRGANLLPSEWCEIVTASLKMSEDPVRNLLLLKKSQKLRELSHLLQEKPAQVLKVGLHRLGWIQGAKVLDSTQEGFSAEEKGLANFL